MRHGAALDLELYSHECFSSSLAVDALLLRELHFPSFSRTFLSAELSNLTCHRIEAKRISTHFFANSSAVAVGDHAEVLCTTHFHLGSYNGLLHVAMSVAPSEAVVEDTGKKPRSDCHTTKATVGACSVSVRVMNLSLDPPNRLLDYFLLKMREYAEKEAERYVCGVLAPRYARVLMDDSLIPPEDPPTSVDPAVPLADWPLYLSLRRVLLRGLLGGRENRLFISVESLPEHPSTLRFVFTWLSSKRFDVSIDVSGAPELADTSPRSLLSTWGSLSSDVSLADIVDALVDVITAPSSNFQEKLETSLFPGSLSGIAGGLVFMGGDGVSIDVTFNDLQCDDSATKMYRCHIPRVSGVQVSNIRFRSSRARSDMSQVFTNIIGPELGAPLINRLVDAALSHDAWGMPAAQVGGDSSDHPGHVSDRVYLPMLEPVVWRTAPPGWAVLVFVLVVTFVSAALLGLSAWRQGRSPVYYTTTAARGALSGEAGDRPTGSEGANASEDAVGSGESRVPVSTRRMLYEDAALVASVAICTACFAWSNCTTAATVRIGGEVPMYTFSLLGTVRDLWGAELYFLSTAVFIFSCVYPYVKLVSILIYTIVLRRPESAVLRVIDYIGKFSFLDTFVMLIMISGMSIYGVVDIQVHASFYLFYFATVGSVLIGNYGTSGWRLGTTVRTDPVNKLDAGEAAGEERARDRTVPLEQASYVGQEHRSDQGAAAAQTPVGPGGVDRPRVTATRRDGTVHWLVSIPSSTVVVLCSLPAWGPSGCLHFSLGSLARLFESSQRTVGIAELINIELLPGLSCVPLYFILLVAPALYTFFYPRVSVLASWCAVDVFLLACVASSLQLNQFVQFVMGPSLRGTFTAHAYLQPQLLPLLIAALIPWGLVSATIMGVDLRPYPAAFINRLRRR